MRALVLGGNGFIGSHLVDHLLKDGIKVRVFDRAMESFREPLKNVEYCLGSFDDFSLLENSLEDIDVVYHLISTSVPSTSNADPVADIQGNLINTVMLLELLVRKKIKKIIYLSSGGTVYGIPEAVPIKENHPINPLCSYGVVKRAIEHYLQMYHYLHDLDYVIFRASNPYGERQGNSGLQGVIGTFINRAIKNESVEIWGDGSVIRDYIYVTDLVELCVKALNDNKVGIYNAGSGIGYSVNEILNATASACSKVLEVKYIEGRAYDIPEVVLDINKAKEDYFWCPKVNLKDGLHLHLKWALRL